METVSNHPSTGQMYSGGLDYMAAESLLGDALSLFHFGE